MAMATSATTTVHHPAPTQELRRIRCANNKKKPSSRRCAAAAASLSIYCSHSLLNLFWQGQNTQQRIPMSQVQEFFLNGMRPEVGHVGNLARTIQQPPQMQRTYTIRNDVNLKKNTLRLVRSESEPSHYHLEFSFDASTSCECCSACIVTFARPAPLQTLSDAISLSSQAPSKSSTPPSRPPLPTAPSPTRR